MRFDHCDWESLAICDCESWCACGSRTAFLWIVAICIRQTSAGCEDEPPELVKGVLQALFAAQKPSELALALVK